MVSLITVLVSVVVGFVLIGVVRSLVRLLQIKRRVVVSDPDIDSVLVWTPRTLTQEEMTELGDATGWDVTDCDTLRDKAEQYFMTTGLQIRDLDNRFWLKQARKARREAEDARARGDNASVDWESLRRYQDHPPLVRGITVPFQRLCVGAARLRLRKMDTTGQFKRFTFHHADQCFKSSRRTFDRKFFTSGERQQVVESLLYSLKSRTEYRSLLPKLVSLGLCTYYPLHDNHWNEHIAAETLQTSGSDSTLAKVVQYYGTELAFYVAWLTTYSEWLLLPAFVGIMLYSSTALESATTATTTTAAAVATPTAAEAAKAAAAATLVAAEAATQLVSPMMLVYAVFITIWSTVFIQAWRRRSADLAHQWAVGTSTDVDADSGTIEPRPEFGGELKPSPVSGRLELYSSPYARYRKYCVSAPICLCFIVLAAVLMIVSFWLERYSLALQQQQYFTRFPLFNTLIVQLPTLFYAVSIPVLNPIYTSVATRLTDWENHRTQEDWNNAQIIKLVSFYFVNYYISLFYCAFYLQDVKRLQSQMATLLVTSQAIGQLFEVLLPWVQEKLALASQEKDLATERAHRVAMREKAAATAAAAAKAAAPTWQTVDVEDKAAMSKLSAKDQRRARKQAAEMAANRKRGQVAYTDEVRKSMSKLVIDSELANAEAAANADAAKATAAGIGAGADVDDDSLSASVRAYEQESIKAPFESTFDDYLEMAMQFGYIVLFGWVWPLACVCALVNNTVELRSDMMKISGMRRASIRNVGGIGSWLDVLLALSSIGVVTNFAFFAVYYLQILPDAQAAAAEALAAATAAGVDIVADAASVSATAGWTTMSANGTQAVGAAAATIAAAAADSSGGWFAWLWSALCARLSPYAWFSWFTSTSVLAQIAILVTLEHSVMAVKALCVKVIPTTPSHVRVAKARRAFEADEFINTMYDKTTVSSTMPGATGRQLRELNAEAVGSDDHDQLRQEPTPATTTTVVSDAVTEFQDPEIALEELIHASKHDQLTQALRMVIVIIMAYLCGVAQISLVWLVVIVLIVSYDNVARERIIQRQLLASFGRKMHSPVELRTICQNNQVPAWLSFAASEESSWLDGTIARLWPFMTSAIERSMFECLNPMFDGMAKEWTDPATGVTSPRTLPSIIKFIVLRQARMSKIPPSIDGVGYERTKDGLCLDIAVVISGEPLIELEVSTQLANFKVKVEHLRIKGTLRLQLKPFMPMMPCVGCVAIGFTQKPDITFQLTTAKIPLSKVPGLSHVLDNVILNSVTPCFVYPNVSVIPIMDGIAESVINDLYAELKQRVGELSVEVVSASSLVNVSGLNVMGKQVLKFGLPDPLVRVTVNAQVHMTHSVSNSTEPVWNAAFRFDVIDPSLETLKVEVLHPHSIHSHAPMGNISLPLDTICDGEMHHIDTGLNDVETGNISLVVQFRRL